MIIIQVDAYGLNAYQLTGDAILYLGKACDINRRVYDNEHILLVLDYDTYFHPRKRNNLLSGQLSHIQPAAVYSPFEITGAYLKKACQPVNDEIQVLDLEAGCCYPFTIQFMNGQYSLSRKTQNDQHIPIESLCNEYLNLSAARVREFDLFLQQESADDKTYAAIVYEGLRQHEAGKNELDEIIKVFDEAAWADITITQLAAFKRKLLQLAGANSTSKFVITGLFSEVFCGTAAAITHKEKLQGAVWLYRNSDNFYAPLNNSVALEAYCFPDALQLPLYTASCQFREYTIPKQIKLYESGRIVFYRDNEPYPVTTGSKQANHIGLTVQVDGNQNLLVTAGSQTYLI